MKEIIDIPDVMYDWLVNGFPDEFDSKMAVKTIQDGEVITEPEDFISRKLVISLIRKGLLVLNSDKKIACKIVENIPSIFKQGEENDIK